MNDNEKFSTTFAKNRIDAEIDIVKNNINYYGERVNTQRQEKKGDYRKYIQQKALLEELKAKKAQINELSNNGESYTNGLGVTIRDKKISDLKDRITEIEGILKASNKKTASKRQLREIKHLTKKLEKLKKKKGKLGTKQIKVIDKKIVKKLKKVEKITNNQAKYEDLDRRIIQSINRANRAEDTLNSLHMSDKKGVKKVAENIKTVGVAFREVTVGLISKRREKRLEKHLEFLARKDSFVQGARKLPSKLGIALKQKIQLQQSNGRSHH